MFKYNPPAGTQPAAAAPVAHPLAPPAAIPQAGALPPVQPAPAAQIPSAQPGAEAAAPATPRRRRGASQVAPPAQPAPQQPAAQPAPQQPAPVYQAQVIAQPQQPAQQLSLPANSWLSTFAPMPGGRSALDVVAAVAEQTGGEQNLFPTIEMMGGTNGGMFDHDTMNEDGINAHLPTGKIRMAGVLLSFRYLFLLWPAAYVTGVKRQPLYRSVSAANQADAAELLIAALKNYTMRTRPPQGSPEPRWDVPTGPGHLQAAVEALVFEPAVGLMCVRSAWTYDSVVHTNNSLKSAFPNGQITPTPVWVENDTWMTQGSKKNPNGWPEHGPKYTPPIAGAVDPSLQNAAAVFAAFATQTANDAELRDMLNEWAQHEMTPEQGATLQLIANMPRQ